MWFKPWVLSWRDASPLGGIPAIKVRHILYCSKSAERTISTFSLKNVQNIFFFTISRKVENLIFFKYIWIQN